MCPPAGRDSIPAPPGGFGPVLGRCSASAETACFLPPGRFPRDERSSRRKNRRFCGAGSLTTARGAGSCGVLKGRCSAHEIVALTLFSVEFGCLLRVTKSCWGVPGLLRHEGPFKKCVAENKEVRKDFLHNLRLFCVVFAPFHLLSGTL